MQAYMAAHSEAWVRHRICTARTQAFTVVSVPFLSSFSKASADGSVLHGTPVYRSRLVAMRNDSYALVLQTDIRTGD